MPTIEASITDVRRKREGSQFVVIRTDPAMSPPLETKYPELAKEALALMQSGDVVVIEYENAPRTDDNGKVWPNHYYKKAHAKPKELAEASLDNLPVERGGEDADRAWRISLAAGAKIAVASLPFAEDDERKLAEQWLLAQWWGVRLFTTSFAQAQASLELAPASSSSADSLDGPPPLTDDDIPF